MGILKSKFIAVTLLIIISSIASADGMNNDSLTKWCRDKTIVLQQALYYAKHTGSYYEERDVLTSAINQVLAKRPKKKDKYFRYTLNIAQEDMLIYPNDVERQVLMLRYYVREAIIDLEYFRIGNIFTDAGPYVDTLLSRGLRLGAQTPKELEEKILLTRSARRGLYWLKNSDYRRSSRYACTVEIIENVLLQVSNPALVNFTKVILLRNGLRRAIRILDIGC